jgi:hypothetical protein
MMPSRAAACASVSASSTCGKRAHRRPAGLRQQPRQHALRQYRLQPARRPRWCDATHWQVNYNGGTAHDVITFMNGAAIDATDFMFV